MSARVVLPQAVYRRAKEPHELPAGLRLRSLEWALYFAVTGKHTAAELGRHLRADSAERDGALSRLLGLALIDEQELDASEYVRALAVTRDSDDKTLREFLIGAVQPATTRVTNEGSEAPREPQQTEGGKSTTRRVVQPLTAGASRTPLREVSDMTVTAPRATLRPARPVQPAFGFQPLPSPTDDAKEKRPMTGSRRLSLRALMNLIERQASSREAGQLDIYRVFVRVDTLLLKRNGIETLRFTDDRLVSDPELEQALVGSVKKTLGLNCPESVWVEGA